MTKPNDDIAQEDNKCARQTKEEAKKEFMAAYDKVISKGTTLIAISKNHLNYSPDYKTAVGNDFRKLMSKFTDLISTRLGPHYLNNKGDDQNSLFRKLVTDIQTHGNICAALMLMENPNSTANVLRKSNSKLSNLGKQFIDQREFVKSISQLDALPSTLEQASLPEQTTIQVSQILPTATPLASKIDTSIKQKPKFKPTTISQAVCGNTLLILGTGLALAALALIIPTGGYSALLLIPSLVLIAAGMDKLQYNGTFFSKKTSPSFKPMPIGVQNSL